MDEVTKIVNLQIKDGPLRTALETVSKLVIDNGGKALVVGGCVRDAIFDRLSKELDIEVHGISWDRLVKILSDCFPIDLVGIPGIDYCYDGQIELLRKLEVTSVMSRYGHDGAGSVTHKYIISNPDWNLFIINRINSITACKDTRFFFIEFSPL